MTAVGTAEQFREVLQTSRPDIAILDIGLPDDSGLVLAREIRARSGMDCGIIVLTAFKDAGMRISCLNEGADVYLVKHASLEEIEATIKSLLRRIAKNHSRYPELDQMRWLLDLRKWELISPYDHRVAVSATEAVILDMLMSNSQSVCERDALAEIAYSKLRRNSSRNLDAIVRRLRRKIEQGTSAPAPIKTVYGVGYVFIEEGSIWR